MKKYSTKSETLHLRMTPKEREMLREVGLKLKADPDSGAVRFLILREWERKFGAK